MASRNLDVTSRIFSFTLAAYVLFFLVGNARAEKVEVPAYMLVEVPYITTPEPVVKRMLDMAKVKKGDMLYDLGCGDGRIVIEAAQRGAKGVGIELNPHLVQEAQQNAVNAGYADKVQFRVQDIFEADFSKASVVTLYLLPEINQKLRPQLWRQLAVGTRVVSHAFDMGPDWPPEKVDEVVGRKIYYWTIRPEHKNSAKIVAQSGKLN